MFSNFIIKADIVSLHVDATPKILYVNVFIDIYISAFLD
jgi:hypothetical protein